MTLVEATDADLEALATGTVVGSFKLSHGPIEAVEVLTMLRDLANAIRPGFSPASWMIVDGDEIVGLCSLVKPPSSDGIDIGYGVAASQRGRGIATAAVKRLLDWARSDSRVMTVRAETSVLNTSSQRVLERNGFERTGQRIDDEDGEMICWKVSVESQG